VAVNVGSGNDAFVCENCKQAVQPLTLGSYRNHCPFCLHSKHVDIVPGDRQNNCLGLMEPVSVEHSTKKGWIILHRCLHCGEIKRNKAALDDRQPDNFDALIAVASSLK